MRVRFVNVGKAVTQEYQGRLERTAFRKRPAEGPLFLGKVGFAEDEQAYSGHGGPDKAALVYAFEHYAYWEEFLGRAVSPAVLGETLTVDGLTEEAACVGDVYQIGEAQVQVSQPRGPCYKIDMVHGRDDMFQRVLDTGYSGMYVRVLKEGKITAGDPVELLRRPPEAPSIAYLNHIRHNDQQNLEAVQRILAAEGLAEAWRQRLQERVDQSLADSGSIR